MYMSIDMQFYRSFVSAEIKPSSIVSHISAISYVHKMCSVSDPTQHFLVRKILKGAQNIGKSPDCRMPITKPILLKLLAALQHTVTDKNNRLLLKAIFLTAFHGFFRLGELVVRSNSMTKKVVQRNDISIEDGRNLQIILRHFKHMRNNQPLSISISASTSKEICQVRALLSYIACFKHSSGPLFSFMSGHPVSHAFVAENLKLALSFCGLDSKLYKGHSFRIGAATEAAKLGISEQCIQQFGRWHSNAIKNYIRINSFAL